MLLTQSDVACALNLSEDKIKNYFHNSATKSLHDATKCPHGSKKCPPQFSGVSIDSRTVRQNDLFFAIKGARVDGHNFIEMALKKGASGLVVSEEFLSKDYSVPCFYVKDTMLALGCLGQFYRKRFNIPFVAITGSCGKTTVKEMLASILGVSGVVLANQGNLNTEFGVPLTLLQCEPRHTVAIIEMGARKAGDIAYLMQLVSPDVTLITNAGVAHIEIFGSEALIAKAKGEIYQHLKPEGIAVINDDDKHANEWRGLLSNQRIVSFGSAVGAFNIAYNNVTLCYDSSHFDLLIDSKPYPIALPVPGLHNVQNAATAAAAAYALKVKPEDIITGLQHFKPVASRLQSKQGLSGVRVIDDSYNANPASVRAALEVLSRHKGQRIFVMGDMLELGSEAKAQHQAMGALAKDLGIERLLGVGPLTGFAVNAFGTLGQHFADKKTLIEALQSLPLRSEETTILVKGSRSMGMQEVVHFLTLSEKNSC